MAKMGLQVTDSALKGEPVRIPPRMHRKAQEPRSTIRRIVLTTLFVLAVVMGDALAGWLGDLVTGYLP